MRAGAAHAVPDSKGDSGTCRAVRSPVELRHLAALGYLMGFQANRLGTLDRLAALGGNVRVTLPGLRFVFVFDAATCRAALGSQFEKLDRGLGLKNLRDAIGETMLTATGDTWREARRNHARTLQAFPDGAGAAAAQAWLTDSGANNGMDVSVRACGDQIATRLISQVTEGHVNGLDMRVERAARSISRRTSWIMTQPFTAVHRLATSVTHAVTRAGHRLSRWSAVDACGSWQTLPSQERLGVLFAGGETISAMFGWAMLRLANHPESQERLRQGDAEASAQFLLEVLRLHPPVWMITRRVIAPFTVGDQAFRIGDHLLFPVWSYHRDAAHFPDPAKFDPSRFSVPQGRYNPMFMPFGSGPHTCPGRHGIFDLFQSAITPLLAAYNILPSTANVDWRGEPELTLFPARDAVLALRPRNFLRARMPPRNSQKSNQTADNLPRKH